MLHFVTMQAAPGQFTIGPHHVFVSRSAPLVFAEKNLPELGQIGDRRVVVVVPPIFICTLGLEPPGSAPLNYANLPFYTVIGANNPGVPIVHD
jgi:hypothetical protein